MVIKLRVEVTISSLIATVANRGKGKDRKSNEEAHEVSHFCVVFHFRDTQDYIEKNLNNEKI